MATSVTGVARRPSASAIGRLAVVAVVVVSTLGVARSADAGPAGAVTPAVVAPQTLIPRGPFTSPQGLATDAAGDLFVTDTDSLVTEIAHGTSTATTLGFSGLGGPSGIAVDAAGDVFVSDYTHDRVVELPVGGAQVMVGFTGLHHPEGLVADASGDLWVADYGNNRVVSLPKGGSQVDLAFSGLDGPIGLARDAAGTIYVGDTFNDRVVKLPSGGSQSVVGFTGLNHPYGVAVDSAGDVFVADGANNRTLELPSGGSQQTLALGYLLLPFAVAVDGSGNVFTADTTNSRVVALPNGGAAVDVGIGLSEPWGLAVDGTGTAYVVDAGSSAVRKRTSGGTVTTVPFAGLGHPTSIAVDSVGSLYVTDSGNHRVVKRTSGGVQSTLGFTGLSYPQGVAVDGNGDVFVSDYQANAVVELSSGAVQSTLGFTGLHGPQGIAVDAAGTVYVADSGDNGILRLPLGGSQSYVGFSGLSNPQAVSVDAAGNLLVADYSNHRVVELASGSAQTTIGFGTIDPRAVFMDAGGDVYVTASNLGGGLLELIPPPPATAPGAPTGVTATAGNQQAQVSWTAPASDGGSPVTGYVVTPYVGAVAKTPKTFASALTTQAMSGLTNGTTYTFKVAAINAIGTGAASAASNSVTPVAPPTAPGVPTAVTATAGDQQAQVSWTAPASNGGSPITGYVITPFEGSVMQPAVTSNGSGTAKLVTGLSNGVSYTFEVAAGNAVGTGSMSSPSNVVTPSRVPSAPSIGSAVAGDGQATVTWTEPDTTGGIPLIDYVVTPYIGSVAQPSVTAASAATSKVVAGLTNGTSYTFRVAAVNADGTGPYSAASNTVTPLSGIKPYAPFASWSAFVARQYTDLTGAAPSGSDLSTWVSALTAGTKGKGDLIAAIRSGPDATANVDPTTRLYRAFLGRPPDASGLKFWLGRRRSGTWTLTRIADNFAASHEFITKYGALSNVAFVTRIYTDVLGREADSSGVTYWTHKLDTHQKTRGGVMVSFSESSEYKRKQAENTDAAVAFIFLRGRAATIAEMADWVTREKAGTTMAALATELLDSAAYAIHIG